MRYSQFYISATRVDTSIYDHAHPNIFQSTFNFTEFVSTCKNSGFFIFSFQRYNLFKNPAIWLVRNILIPNFSKTFPGVQQLIETSNNRPFKKKIITNFHTHSNNLKLGLFSPFLEKIFFNQNPAVITTCEPLTPFWVPEKLKSQFKKKKKKFR